MKGRWILKGIGFAILTVAGILAFSYIFMLLWNWLVPVLFNGPVITFTQGIGLLLLGKMLFGGFRSKWGRGCHHCGGHGYYGGWKGKMRHRMMNMTPEEREKFRAKMKERCGYTFEDTEEQPKA